MHIVLKEIMTIAVLGIAAEAERTQKKNTIALKVE
jgi:hypothetical protein